MRCAQPRTGPRKKVLSVVILCNAGLVPALLSIESLEPLPVLVMVTTV